MKIVKFQGLHKQTEDEIETCWQGQYLALQRTRKGSKDYKLFHIKTGFLLTNFDNVKFKEFKEKIIELDKNEIWNFGEFGKSNVPYGYVQKCAAVLLEFREKHNLYNC